MKNLLIIIGLALLCPMLNAQSISSKQKKQLQQIGTKNNQQFQRVLSKSDRIILKRMQNDLDAVKNLRSDRQRALAIQAFNRKYAKFRSGLMQKAGFSNDTFCMEVNAVFPRRQFKKGKQGFYSVNKNILRNKGPRIQPNSKFDMLRNPGKASKVSSKESKAPNTYASANATVKFRESGCSSTSYQGGFEDDGGFTSFATASFAGGCTTIRGTGNNIQVPSGVKSVRVKVTLNDGYTLSTSAAGIFGYGHSQTEVGIRIKGPGMEAYHKDSDILTIAPALYYAEMDAEEEDLYIMETTFTPRQSGGNYRIQAYGKSFSMGIVGGIGVGYTQVDEVNKIEAFFTY